jgi:hypothetical protein
MENLLFTETITGVVAHIYFLRQRRSSRTRLEGVRALVERYRGAGITSIAQDFYPGGRHEMLHELNRREVFTNLLVWISGILERASR